MKKLWILVLLSVAGKAMGQQGERVITTAVPFLTIASDARSSAMGDIGVATTTDTVEEPTSIPTSGRDSVTRHLPAPPDRPT